MVKVSELTGAKLDYWVYRAENGKSLADFTGGTVPYSTDWKWGGPIIEREKIRWQPLPDEGKVFCWTHITKEMDPINGMRGGTILQAAMRCFVASKFGEEVSDGD